MHGIEFDRQRMNVNNNKKIDKIYSGHVGAAALINSLRFLFLGRDM